jgi:hypothetical protein
MYRILHQDDSTIGVLDGVPGVPGCFTLEDEARAQKVHGDTRIPAGRYRILLRKEGAMHPKYAAKYKWHKGMLWLQDVPGFDYIYIHIGNTTADTLGCILVGDVARILAANGDGRVEQSAAAYERIAKPITEAIEQGVEVYIDIEEHYAA